MDWGDILPIDMPCGTTTRPLMESGERSAGGLISTVDDLSRFIQSYMNGELFDISYFEEIYDFVSLGADVRITDLALCGMMTITNCTAIPEVSEVNFSTVLTSIYISSAVPTTAVMPKI